MEKQLTKPQERNYYSVCEECGRKVARYHGYSWLGEDSENGEGAWRFVETWGRSDTVTIDGKLIEQASVENLSAYDIANAIFGIETLKHAERSYTDEEMVRLQRNFYGAGNPGKRLPFREISGGTPCGDYWFEEEVRA